MIEELELQLEELHEQLEFNEISYLVERLLTEAEGDWSKKLYGLILAVMGKMTIGERDKLVVLLFSQLATEQNPDFENLLSILVQAKNTAKCIRFSYNLVTKNYG